RTGAAVVVSRLVEGRAAALAAAGRSGCRWDSDQPDRGQAVTARAVRSSPATSARHRSLWLVEALGREELGLLPPVRGAARADVVIVGGGYTGLWTALHLKEREPDLDVVILEADICGGGASGRNGGFVLSWWPKLETLIDMFGEMEGIRLAWASDEAVGEIGAFCDANGIDAHYT